MNAPQTIDVTPAVHDSFCVERTFPQPPARVFAAFADKDLVRRWRVEDDNCEIHEFAFDFRVGGHEVSRFTFAGGPEIRLDAEFQHIVPDRRIVFTYRMAAGDMALSASLTTIELTPWQGGTRLTFTEQGAFFAGPESAAGREEGCRFLMEKLAAFLARPN